MFQTETEASFPGSAFSFHWHLCGRAGFNFWTILVPFLAWMCAVENCALTRNIFPGREGVLEKDGSWHAAGQGATDVDANPKKAEWEVASLSNWNIQKLYPAAGAAGSWRSKVLSSHYWSLGQVLSLLSLALYRKRSRPVLAYINMIFSRLLRNGNFSSGEVGCVE